MSRTTPFQAYKQPNAPDQTLQPTPDNPIPWIDDIWMDITSHTLKQCTSTNPYIWVQISGSGGGPSLADPFVTFSVASDLTNQKVLTAGTGITLTPGSGILTVTASGSAPTMLTDQFTPDSSTQAFTLSHTPHGVVILQWNGLIQTPGGVDYTISGTSVTTVFTASTGDELAAYYI